MGVARRLRRLGVALGLTSVLLAGPGLAAQDGDVITTVAGTNTRGFSGDGGPAIAAQLTIPEGVAIDAAGNLYIADTANCRIREVTPAGTISTVAGSGVCAFSGDFSGDGGPATAAQLYYPEGVATDAAGNLYIADAYVRIRKVSPAGTITTVAGSGAPGYSGDGGLAIAAQLDRPTDMAVSPAGNLYIADTFNRVVREVSTRRVKGVVTRGVITTIAGTGVDGFSGDGGAATAARLGLPAGLAFDAAGRLFIADNGEFPRIRMVSTAGTISTVAGTGIRGFSGDGGPATAAQFAGAGGVAIDAHGNLYIADSGNNRIRMVSTAGTITTVAGGGAPAGFSGDGGPATAAQLDTPLGIDVDAAGNLYIADSGNHRVRVVNTPPTASFTATPTAGLAPVKVAFDASASSDPNGTIASYSWSFGDGQKATGQTANHTYKAAGTYTATLTVKDNFGAPGSATRKITATVVGVNIPPTASFTAAPHSGNAPLGVSFDATGSRDPDGTIASYSWSFGDGGAATGSATHHAYAAPGSYQVTLTVRDDHGATDSASDLLSVTRAAFTLTVSAAARQHVVARSAFFVRARCNELCTTRITGRLSLGRGKHAIRLRGVQRKLAAGLNARIPLSLPRAARAAIGLALRRGSHVTAMLTVTARNAVGDVTTATRRVRVLR